MGFFASMSSAFSDFLGSRSLAVKSQDEQKALQLCQSKVRAKKLPMEVIDAEYQWCVMVLRLLGRTVSNRGV